MKVRPVILCGGAGTRLWPNQKIHQAKQFIDLARAVYINNDQRSEIKKKINELTGSYLIEEKSYKSY